MIFCMIVVGFLFIPIYSKAITVDSLCRQRTLELYDNVRNIFILIISMLLIVSIITICINKRKYNHYRYLVTLVEIILTIFYIIVESVYKLFDGVYIEGLSIVIERCFILFGLGSIIMQFINIKYNSKIKKDLFNIFAIIGLISVIGVVICVETSINRIEKEEKEYSESYSIQHSRFINDLIDNRK